MKKKLNEAAHMRRLVSEGVNLSKASKDWADYLWQGVDKGMEDYITNGDHGIDDFLGDLGYDSDAEDYFDEPYDKAWDVIIAAQKAAEKAFKAAIIANAKKMKPASEA